TGGYRRGGRRTPTEGSVVAEAARVLQQPGEELHVQDTLLQTVGDRAEVREVLDHLQDVRHVSGGQADLRRRAQDDAVLVDERREALDLGRAAEQPVAVHDAARRLRGPRWPDDRTRDETAELGLVRAVAHREPVRAEHEPAARPAIPGQ